MTTEREKEYGREWYRRNRQHRLDSNKHNRAKIIAWFREYKAKQECKYCGESDFRCLDFHHRNPEEKTFHVSWMSHHSFSIERILQEISKCDVLCANCHRKETFKDAPCPNGIKI